MGRNAKVNPWIILRAHAHDTACVDARNGQLQRRRLSASAVIPPVVLAEPPIGRIS